MSGPPFWPSVAQWPPQGSTLPPGSTGPTQAGSEAIQEWCNYGSTPSVAYPPSQQYQPLTSSCPPPPCVPPPATAMPYPPGPPPSTQPPWPPYGTPHPPSGYPPPHYPVDPVTNQSQAWPQYNPNPFSQPPPQGTPINVPPPSLSPSNYAVSTVSPSHYSWGPTDQEAQNTSHERRWKREDSEKSSRDSSKYEDRRHGREQIYKRDAERKYDSDRRSHFSSDRDYSKRPRSPEYLGRSYSSRTQSSSRPRSRSPCQRSYRDRYSRLERERDRSPEKSSRRSSRSPDSRSSSRLTTKSPESSRNMRRSARSPVESRSYCRSSRSPIGRNLSKISRSPGRKRSRLSSSPERKSSRASDSPSLFSKKDDEEEELGEGEEEEETKTAWVRSAPADLFYQRDELNPRVMRGTKRLVSLCDMYEKKIVERGKKVRAEKLARRALVQEDAKDKMQPCGHPSIQDAGVSKLQDGGCEEKGEMKGNTYREEEDGQSVHFLAKEVEGKGEKNSACEADTESDGEEENSECRRDSKGNESSRNLKELKKKRCRKKAKHTSSSDNDSSSNESTCEDSSGSSSEDDCDDNEECDRAAKELEKKRSHPDRLHPELWFNDPGEMNDGPLCRCSQKAQRSGIRHGFYVGEDHLDPCDPWTNNVDRLYHYLITISPPTNFLVKTPTVINHDSHEFIFEGFSLFSHYRLEELPTCRVIRFNIEYTILYIEEKMPDNFCVKELDLFYEYLFHEILELVDLDLHAVGDSHGCPCFHFMPRFVRKLPDNGKEILSMNEVLNYLYKSSRPLIEPEELARLLAMPQFDWQNYADQVKGMVVTCPGMKPCSIRVDQLDRDQVCRDTINYPVIVHFGIRPPQLSYAGNPDYQKAWREYVKFRHLLANMPKPSYEDKRRLEAKENKLQEMRMTSKMKRDVTVAVSAQGFYRTGIMCDVVQHAMLLPVLVCHLRFHRSLNVLEERLQYKFKHRYLLQLALTHPSYRENFGTNPDHARNSLTNCGIRQPEYGDRRIHYMNTRKRGINTLINIMSRFGKNSETESKITHNERLEFLGDAVVEFLTSIHLFHLFPNLEEGGLATYRAAIVQNQHLAVLAEKLSLDQFMLYAHGSDLCHDFELRHAMANCFEALMGAIFLDSGIEEADCVLSNTLFKGEETLHKIWVYYPPHPLQEQEPDGDRKWIESFPILQKLKDFEESIGISFNHIRLLARAFTDRSIGINNLTLGSNQRLEFLGDTVLQLVASEYLYRYFPEHHEGHLSLLRSSLVNNRTQAVVCDDLGMTKYAVYSHLKTELKTKDRADLLEAFLGAFYIDRGLDYCRVFCQVCFFPRLHLFIMNQDWNDPKSKLQQCCLTLRTMNGSEPDIPIYKVIECKGPTNTRVYTVAVYFRGQRMAKASGHSIQQAEMNAAKEALLNSKELFPQLDHQKRVIEKSLKIQGRYVVRGSSNRRSNKNEEKHQDQRLQSSQELMEGEELSDEEEKYKAPQSGDRHWDQKTSRSSESVSRHHSQGKRYDGNSGVTKDRRANITLSTIRESLIESGRSESRRDHGGSGDRRDGRDRIDDSDRRDTRDGYRRDTRDRHGGEGDRRNGRERFGEGERREIRERINSEIDRRDRSGGEADRRDGRERVYSDIDGRNGRESRERILEDDRREGRERISGEGDRDSRERAFEGERRDVRDRIMCEGERRERERLGNEGDRRDTRGRSGGEGDRRDMRERFGTERERRDARDRVTSEGDRRDIWEKLGEIDRHISKDRRSEARAREEFDGLMPPRERTERGHHGMSERNSPLHSAASHSKSMYHSTIYKSN